MTFLFLEEKFCRQLSSVEFEYANDYLTDQETLKTVECFVVVVFFVHRCKFAEWCHYVLLRLYRYFQ